MPPADRSVMMEAMVTTSVDRSIAAMPRGGPDASCLDRLLQTDRPEYLDRDPVDVADEARKRSVIRALDWTGEVFGNHDRFAQIALDEVADVADPRVLELGAGHGKLSRRLLDWHPTARLTVTDVDQESVRTIAAGELGQHPRATVRTLDATAMDAGDGEFDLAVFVLSFHHLAPEAAARVFAEGTRVATRLLIVDLPRPPAPLHLLRLATMLPFAPLVPFVHDGVISSLRAYSPSALRALAAHADPAIEVTLRGGLLSPQVVLATRPH
jgi:SAM-dependent methyltransferase